MLAEQAWCQFREVLISQKTGMLYLLIIEGVCNAEGIAKTHFDYLFLNLEHQMGGGRSDNNPLGLILKSPAKLWY